MITDEPWTKEEFEDHWYSVMPPGILGVAVPCDCGEEGCHGWRMKVTHWPEVPQLLDEKAGLTFSMPPGVILHSGDTLNLTWTRTFD